jgi:uncharacterized metal-binding protein
MPDRTSPPPAACAECPFKNAEKVCMAPGGKHPETCPTANQQTVVAAAMTEYAKPEIAAFARNACIQEGAGYADRDRGYTSVRPLKPRILEIAEFARRMDYGRLGLIFCAGLVQEGKRVAAFYREKGFEVVSAICKVGQVPKEKIGVRDEEKIAASRHESICNPIAQAMLMNAAKTQLNILVGLCVGHDSMVFKYSDAPCTVLAAKDRVFGHNPLAAVYTLDSYYRYLKQPLE